MQNASPSAAPRGLFSSISILLEGALGVDPKEYAYVEDQGDPDYWLMFSANDLGLSDNQLIQATATCNWIAENFLREETDAAAPLQMATTTPLEGRFLVHVESPLAFTRDGLQPLFDWLQTAMDLALQCWGVSDLPGYEALRVSIVSDDYTREAAENNLRATNDILNQIMDFHFGPEGHVPNIAQISELDGNYAVVIDKAKLHQLQDLEGLAPGCEEYFEG